MFGKPMLVFIVLLLASAATSAMVEIKNCIDLEIYFIWVSEAKADKWVDILGLEILDVDETVVFHVDAGYYNIRIEDSNWETYSIMDIPMGENSTFVWHVCSDDKD